MSSPGERLRAEIAERGPIPFARFMEEALYGEGGYYAGAELRIGPDGDFVTGSSLSPLFGGTTARLVEALDGELGGTADYLEVGYGVGAHLSAVVGALDPGRSRRVLAWDRVERALPDGVTGLGDLEEVEGGSVRGLLFSYELFDALPVHRLVGRGGGLSELLVGLGGDGGFCWVEGELSDPGLAKLVPRELAEGQIADLAPGWRPLYRRLAETLGRGLLVTCDYGFDAARLLDPRVRMHGTLACYRRQRVHRDPFVSVGEQDLTAHVDFSSLIEEGERAGLTTLLLVPQAVWLAACGLLDAAVPGASLAARTEVHQLMDLEGMGEEIRVLVQARDLSWQRVLALLPGGGLLAGAGPDRPGAVS